LFASFVSWVVGTVDSWGYFGIFVSMFLESSFFPFPSEVVMIPAGYLAFQGKMNLLMAIFSGIAGSLSGALFNYFLAAKYGRPFLLRYGKYFFLKPESLQKLELFFAKHGDISTFNGRLIPGIRQYISMPAGLAGMHLGKFSLYTVLGAGIWVSVLALLGYYLGANEDQVAQYLKSATLAAMLFIVGLSLFYWLHQKNKGSL
jgi:membrane protein DedA with SNARE-associated domain